MVKTERCKLTGKQPPDWALLLVAQVCADHGRRVPSLQWWTRDGKYSSGHYWPARKQIHVTAGTDPQDQQGVLLHELAHHLTVPRKVNGSRSRRRWHNKRFYTKAFELYAQWGDEEFVAYEAKREAHYMKRSTSVSGYSQ